MERKGSLIRWMADCGHWMVAYSLEPTPIKCPDCADKGRDDLESVLKQWRGDISSAESYAGDCGCEDVAEWLSEDGITLPDETVKRLQVIADRCGEAAGELHAAGRDIRKLFDELPEKAERLCIPGG